MRYSSGTTAAPCLSKCLLGELLYHGRLDNCAQIDGFHYKFDMVLDTVRKRQLQLLIQLKVMRVTIRQVEWDTHNGMQSGSYPQSMTVRG